MNVAFDRGEEQNSNLQDFCYFLTTTAHLFNGIFQLKYSSSKCVLIECTVPRETFS